MLQKTRAFQEILWFVATDLGRYYAYPSQAAGTQLGCYIWFMILPLECLRADRVEILQSLTAQATISLENAGLYEERKRSEQRTS